MVRGAFHVFLSSLSLISGAGVLASCGDADSPSGPPGDGTGQPAEPLPPGRPEELVGQLAALAAPCTFVNGTLKVTVQNGETAIIRLEGEDFVVNDVACNGAAGATVNTVKRLEVVEGISKGNETVFLDFRNGLFARGSSVATHGIYISLGGSPMDILQISINEGNDNIIAGSSGIRLDADNFRDISLSANTVSLINISMGSGDDTFTGLGGGSAGIGLINFPLRVWGGDGNDSLRGGGRNDELNGDAGDDTLTADTLSSAGADTYTGGADVDTLSYAARTLPLTISLDDVANDGNSMENDNVKSDVEVITGGTAADTITGGAGNETINGGAGNDILRGGGGTDELNGEAGNDTFIEGTDANGSDTFNGGAGIDTVDYSGRSMSVLASIGNDGDSDGESGENDRVGADIEVLIGGSGNDTLTGGDGNDRLVGGGGTDSLSGGAGNDTFDEGAATNGNDTFNGGDGFDTVDYGARSVGIIVTLGDAMANDGQSGENDRIEMDVERVVGSQAADTITGSASKDVIDSGEGNDTITGGDGDDTLNGEGGDDNITCGEGNDVALGGNGTDTFSGDCELANQ